MPRARKVSVPLHSQVHARLRGADFHDAYEADDALPQASAMDSRSCTPVRRQTPRAGTSSKKALDTIRAGRMSRAAANKTITEQEAQTAMQGIVHGHFRGKYEEAPQAYKNIEDVMSWQKDLVKPIVKLQPLGVMKG